MDEKYANLPTIEIDIPLVEEPGRSPKSYRMFNGTGTGPERELDGLPSKSFHLVAIRIKAQSPGMMTSVKMTGSPELLAGSGLEAFGEGITEISLGNTPFFFAPGSVLVNLMASKRTKKPKVTAVLVELPT